MAGLVESALELSLRALVARDRQLAYSVILRDQYIDELETELNRLTLEFLARHQPVAGHLRFAFAAIQINKELERIGDYAESVARQTLVISSLEPQPAYEKFVELGELAIHMFGDAVQSFLKGDGDLAARTMRIEERANTLRNNINAEVAEAVKQGALPQASLNPLLTVARRFERVTDQAKNFCEEVLYMCTGEFVKHKGTDLFRILFVDSSNACLGQMAEGIARAMNRPRMAFSSAGITPRSVIPLLAEFMNGKGIDVSSQTSKSLDQVADLEHFQVIVTLDPNSRKMLPDFAAKTIVLAWSIEDPISLEGGPEVVKKGFERAWEALSAHIAELLDAISKETPHP